ncbi:16S rRNA (guanine(527)-N(7))-methyltransferase RsmG [Compostibacter hankyongensis]|uniref:Ribosomal RNA small subunit methyltransferase G n=1 Tax=Compostibacter hankyongensis TaxID=1007089 RepID=A0ABP8FYH1_9BACT
MEIILKYFGDFSEKQLQQLAALEPLYRSWNEKINVISRKDIDSLYEKHVLHALGIAVINSFGAGQSVIDIGTGGGFPGIPLAIFFPDTQFHLVDATGKKIKVVEAVAEALKLDNVSTQHARVEDIRDRKFDAAVSRAVAPLATLCRWSKAVLRKKGTLFCLKGGDLHDEISGSGYRPRIYELEHYFPEPFFREKYLLSVTL